MDPDNEWREEKKNKNTFGQHRQPHTTQDTSTRAHMYSFLIENKREEKPIAMASQIVGIQRTQLDSSALVERECVISNYLYICFWSFFVPFPFVFPVHFFLTASMLLFSVSYSPFACVFHSDFYFYRKFIYFEIIRNSRCDVAGRLTVYLRTNYCGVDLFDVHIKLYVLVFHQPNQIRISN